MLCRALLTAIAISYLMCVLWLSGMQKEDLEVNMLRKLQQHNVNIDDINAKNLRQECLNSQLKESNTTNEGNETVENQSTQGVIDSNQKMNQFLSSDQSSILTQQLDEQKLGPATVKANVNKIGSSLKLSTDNSKNEYTGNNSPEVTTFSFKPTETDQPKLESIIQFWQKLTKANQPHDFEHFTAKEQRAKEHLPRPEAVQTNSQTKLEGFLQFWQMITKTFSETTTYKTYNLVDYTTQKPSVTGNKTPERINTNGLPNLETIMKFWQKFTTSQQPQTLIDTAVTEGNYYVAEHSPFKQTITKAEEEINQSKESEIIKKLFAKYVHKSQKPQATTKKTTTTQSIDLKKLSLQIEKLLQLFPQEQNLTSSDISKDDQNETKIKTHLPPKNFNVKEGIPNKSLIFSERTKYYKQFRNERNKYEFISNEDMNYKRQDPLKNNRNQKIIPNYEHYEEIRSSTNEPVTTKTKENSSTEKEDMRSLSKDVIKEIADNVKSIVLNDIRKEISSTGMSPTVATVDTTTISVITTSSTAVTTQAATGQNPNQVLENIMKMFEQFKINQSMNEKTVATTDSIVKTTEKTNLHWEYQNPLSTNNAAPMMLVNSYKEKRLSDNTPIFYSPFGIQNVPSNIGLTQNLPARQASVHTDHNRPYSHQKIIVEPIMMQTNSGEIPPLGIPVAKPLGLIHQNIIMTTNHPITTYTKRRESWNRMQSEPNSADKIRFTNGEESTRFYSNPSRPPENPKLGRAYQRTPYRMKEKAREQREEWNNVYKPDTDFKDTSQLNHERSSKYISSPRSSENSKISRLHDTDSYKPLEQRTHGRIRVRNRQDSKRPLYNSRYEEILNSKLNSEYHEPKDDNREEPHFDTISIGTFSRHRNGERFHEKLEKIEDLRGQSAEGGKKKEEKCYNELEVASRKQRPLAGEKKSSGYDDAHFRNFLRTQQKVNDMLERILATKTVRDAPRSVETT